MLDGVHKLIDSATAEPANFPPTLVFNEGWLLRIVLDWYSKNKCRNHVLFFQPKSTWFSEALLPSPFPPRHRGDSRGESRTHADGMIGHIAVGGNAKADARLLADATQLIILEAKIYSPLSGGTRNAPNYNQAARNVSCITELLHNVNIPPSKMTSLAFYVLAPEAQINLGIFTQKLNKDNIKKVVQERTETYSIELSTWFTQWFTSTIETICIEEVSWESIIGDIEMIDPQAYQSIKQFYHNCLVHNGPGLTNNLI